LPYYADFATTTLLISDHKYDEALKAALALQQKMNDEIAVIPSTSDRSFGDELFALNLLRVAILQQQAGDAAGELKSWQQWKQYAGLENAGTSGLKVSPVAFRYSIQQLAIGSISLPDYIASRESQLKH
jgi:hypothetical protein